MMGTSMELDADQMPGLARLWSRRLTLVEEPELGFLDFTPAQEPDEVRGKKSRCGSPSGLQSSLQEFWESEHSDSEQQDQVKAVPLRAPTTLHLDGSTLGDIPARYVVPELRRHEFPVVGVYIDPRVVPGFRYRVRVIQEQDWGRAPLDARVLFRGRALLLEAVGRGYARRLVFRGDGNFFWSDSQPLGYAFELEVTRPGDKFTLHDANHVAAGTLEILENQAPQEEVDHVVHKDGAVEKTVRMKALCKVEWFENGQSAIVIPVTGLATVVRPRAGEASVTKVSNVAVGSHHRRGFTLTPGVNDRWRRTTVSGLAIGDVPTRYTITGLEAHELPVIGTYVDPRILPGFHYRVRPAGSKKPLFGGRSMRLMSVGQGYGKRLTFAPDENALNASGNFFWSDSHPEGLGFEPRAVHAGMRFAVSAGGLRLGEASVFRADAVQQEERQELVKTVNGTTVVKHIHVEVTCHVALATTNETKPPEPHVMRVSGTAVLSREAGRGEAKLIRIENVGLDSQLNLLFVIQEAELVFHPL